jgi:hypothetical protein
MFPHFRREQESCLSETNVSLLEERTGGPAAGNEHFITFGEMGGTYTGDKCYLPLREGMAIMLVMNVSSLMQLHEWL